VLSRRITVLASSPPWQSAFSSSLCCSRKARSSQCYTVIPNALDLLSMHFGVSYLVDCRVLFDVSSQFPCSCRCYTLFSCHNPALRAFLGYCGHLLPHPLLFSSSSLWPSSSYFMSMSMFMFMLCCVLHLQVGRARA
jgi:hypothetical protein